MLHIVPLLHNSILHRIRDLQHGSRRCCLVTTHNVLDDHAIITPFFGSEDRPSDYGGVLEFGKVLLRGIDLIVLHIGENSALHTCAAYPTLRNPVPPSRTIWLMLVDNWNEAGLKGWYLLEVPPWSQIVEAGNGCFAAESWCDGRMVGSLTRSCDFP